MTRYTKSGPLSKTDLEFLGYSEIERKTPGNFSLPDRCRVFDATARAGIGSIRHWFVYLLGECTSDDLKKVESALKSDLFRDKECHIVIPKSLSSRSVIRSMIKSHNQVHMFEDLIWSKIQQVFEEYIRDLRGRVDNLKMHIPYVEPSLSIREETLYSPIEHFVDFFSNASDDSMIAVVNADAGVGKTTLAVMVADMLLQQWESLHVVPVLLTGQMSWRDLVTQLDGATSLWDALSIVLNLEGGSFPLNNETLFINLVRQGYIAFIFDGFDELRSIHLSPRDNFAWMGGIAEESAARLMVTTRISFWRREIGDPGIPHKVFHLKPFSRDNAHKYFEKRLQDEEEIRNKAKQIYSQLDKETNDTGNENIRFVNLPACAAMIADYVMNGGKVPMISSNEMRNMINEFLSGVLDRERERQEIITGIDELRNVFGDVAISYMEFPIDALEIAGLRNEDLDAIRDHAFLGDVPGDSTDKYHFKYEFLLHYLRATHILSMLAKHGGKDFIEKKCKSDLHKLLLSEIDGKGHLSDQIASLMNDDELKYITEAHNSCNTNTHKLKSFFFHVIVKNTVLYLSGGSRRDRTERIFGLLGAQGSEIERLFVEGSIAELSLGGWTIRNSRFVDLKLIKCEIDNLTFSDCQFSGDLDLPDTGKCTFENCESRDGAKLIISNTNSSADLTEEDIRDYLRTILRQRFYPKNFFRTIGNSEWKTGITKKIEERFGLLNLMKEEGLVEETSHHRLMIRKQKIGEMRDFIDNGILRGSVKAVFRKMINQI